MSDLLNVEEQKQINYCRVCYNAAVEPKLTSENDLGYIGVGRIVDGYGMCIKSGNGKPTALIISRQEGNLVGNVDIGSYKMKFCPECGRKLIENIF